MMIEIQKDISGLPSVDQALLKQAIKITLSTLGKSAVDITLRLTNDAEMQQLNQSYRGEAITTDVLAFNQDFIDPETGRLYLGDIIISLDRAIEQAADQDHGLDEECVFLAIHGTLHLLGYDHYEPEEKTEMWALQDSIFNKVVKEDQED
jgi:probable rRNA maturation factor